MKRKIIFIFKVLVFVFISLVVIWWNFYEVTNTNSEVVSALKKYKNNEYYVKETKDFFKIEWYDNSYFCFVEIYQTCEDALKREISIDEKWNHFKHRNVIFFTENKPLMYEYFGMIEELR